MSSICPYSGIIVFLKEQNVSYAKNCFHTHCEAVRPRVQWAQIKILGTIIPVLEWEFQKPSTYLSIQQRKKVMATKLSTQIHTQARRQGGFEGIHLNPPFNLKRFNTPPSPTICNWSTRLSLASIEHHCPSTFGCSYVLCLFIEDQQMNLQHVHNCFTLKG